MHVTQKNLLALAQIEELEDLSYRQIAERIGCEHASQVKHHLDQLIKHGYLLRNANGQLLIMGKVRHNDSNVLAIPIMGEADCGEATSYASDEIRGYLSVSPSVINRSDPRGIFVLRARGNSMNRAHVDGSKPIDDGDYVLVEKCDLSGIVEGDYVVSIIQGLANVKRFELDLHNQRIVLVPESYDSHYNPIIIADEDIDTYSISGKVVDVIKGFSSF